ncbi:hypothetical protein M9Y10_001425 [Tritrichomonas musculus]|uniref:Uncharacterized protein n=1 Tax=Tritrichomonas musculus TaxID=1915356 RepID=A0ABR2L6Z3_9EUKA
MFTSETSKEALRTKSEKSAMKEIINLKKRITLLENTVNDYRRKYINVSNELCAFKKANPVLKNLHSSYPYLFYHIASMNVNSDSKHAANGNRFNPKIDPIYLLINTAGEYVMSLLHKYFGFPTTKTCRNIRKSLKEKYQIDNKIFDGTKESIKKLVDLFWNDKDKRCVVAVDAAAVNSKVTIHKDGRIEGLLTDLTIDTDLVETIINDPEAFHQFYKQHQEEIVKYFFVFYICSLSQKNKSFPVLVKKKTSGAANNEIIADLEQLVHICNDVKLQVVSISFDGDASYLQYVDNMFQHIQKLPRLDLRCPLSGIIKEYVDVLIFEDMFHLVKCCRYRFVCGSDICPSERLELKITY